MSEQADYLELFTEESHSYLSFIEKDIQSLKDSDKSMQSDCLQRLVRCIHMIHVAAIHFDIKSIVNLSQLMNQLLSLARDLNVGLTDDMKQSLANGFEVLSDMCAMPDSSDALKDDSLLETLSQWIKQIVLSDEKLAPLYAFQFPQQTIKKKANWHKQLYAIRIHVFHDLILKQKTPHDMLHTMDKLGCYEDGFPDIRTIDPQQIYIPEFPFIHALFSTIMAPEFVHIGLDIPLSSITHIDTSAFVKPPVKKPPPAEDDKAIKAKDSQAEAALKDASKAKKQVVRIQAEEKIRVGVSFLNDLVNIAGELVLGRNQLMQITSPHIKETPGLNKVLQHINRVTTEMQDRIMQMRMQPVSLLFSKFQRIVRDLSKTLKKEISLEIYGEEVELDKTIIEALSDPMTHLVRNSVDHGIEKPEDREKKGKPRAGQLILKAYHEGGQVHIEIRDDGKGINGQIIGQKALEKGVISANELQGMTEKDRIQLIFKPGFSTAEEVSSISGRGVCMDVVLTNIKQMGGIIDVDSVVDRGTNIHITLPLTLAIVSGVVIQICNQTFIIPEANIEELVRIKVEDIENRIDLVHGAFVLKLRDMLIPLIDLAHLFGIHSNGFKPTIPYYQSLGHPIRILILKFGTSPFGLIVDTVENIEEIVVKPLPRYLKTIKTFSSACILGNGTVALIIDVAGIVEKAGLHHLSQSIEYIDANRSETKSTDEVQTLLIFNNNTEEQFALPLQLITRIERVPVSKIEKIKNQQFLQYQNKKLRLIFLEDYLPVDRPDRSQMDTIGVIVPKHIKYPMGIVMNEVINTETLIVKLDTSTLSSPCLFGTASIHGKITLFPDMYKLFQMATPDWIKQDTNETNGNDVEPSKILLVEDTPFFTMIIRNFLVSAGYNVIQAENGVKAIEKLNMHRVDAVVSDIIMPEMDGFELIKNIRENEKWRDLPVLAITTLHDDSSKQRGLKEGFTDWELKLDKNSLLNKLSAMIH